MNINPKFKTLNPKQTQNSKFKMRFKTFEFLILDLFRVSDLGFRVYLILICLVFISGCRQNPPLYKETRVMMGTYVEVKSPYKEAAVIAFDEIKRIEHLLSKYDEDSEINFLNKTGQLNPSKETLYVLKKTKEFWQVSDGAFDVTVGPLVDLWGFTNKQYEKPREVDIKNALAFIGMDKVIINDKENSLQFMVSGMKIDLGAIGKGYAVDRAIRKLKEKGIDSCLVNAGGHIFCLGKNSNRPWHIAIRSPREENSFYGRFDLIDKAVATSGDYEQYFIKNNIRYSHIINTKTGYPANSGVISVTVIADDCLTADVLATAIFALGREKGLALAKKYPDVKVEVIEENNKNLVSLRGAERRSPALAGLRLLHSLAMTLLIIDYV